MKVFDTKCCHFYGSQAWIYNENGLAEFNRAWNRCVRHLLKLPYTTHSRFLQHIAKSNNAHDRVCNMFTGMLKSMFSSDNYILKRLARYSDENSRTIVAMNRHYIEAKYNIIWSVTPFKLSSCECTINDFATIEAIKDLICKKTIFDKTETFEFLNFLCCN